MRQARKARRIVDRADLEPDHLGDDRRAVIGDHQHLHAVLQARTGTPWALGCAGAGLQGRRSGAATEQRVAIAERG